MKLQALKHRFLSELVIVPGIVSRLRIAVNRLSVAAPVQPWRSWPTAQRINWPGDGKGMPGMGPPKKKYWSR